MEEAEHVPGLPPGFELEQTPEGAWLMVPPAGHAWYLYIKGIMGPSGI